MWKRLVKEYGIEGFPIAVRGAPYDDLSRWRVFKTTDDVSVDRLPPGIATDDKGKDKDKNAKVIVFCI